MCVCALCNKVMYFNMEEDMEDMKDLMEDTIFIDVDMKDFMQ